MNLLKEIKKIFWVSSQISNEAKYDRVIVIGFFEGNKNREKVFENKNNF